MKCVSERRRVYLLGIIIIIIIKSLPLHHPFSTTTGLSSRVRERGEKLEIKVRRQERCTNHQPHLHPLIGWQTKIQDKICSILPESSHSIRECLGLLFFLFKKLLSSCRLRPAKGNPQVIWGRDSELCQSGIFISSKMLTIPESYLLKSVKAVKRVIEGKEEFPQNRLQKCCNRLLTC